MSFLKQDANNFATKENCWNFVTIMLRTNGYVLSTKWLYAAVYHSLNYSAQNEGYCLSEYFVIWHWPYGQWTRSPRKFSEIIKRPLPSIFFPSHLSLMKSPPLLRIDNKYKLPLLVSEFPLTLSSSSTPTIQCSLSENIYLLSALIKVRRSTGVLISP